MKACIILWPKEDESVRLANIGASLSQGLESQGHQCDIVNIAVDTDKRLTLYDYLIVVAEPLSAFSKNVSPRIGKYFENAGSVSGKRAATILVGGIRKSAAMSTLMRIVESEGIILKTSEFISKPGEAKAFSSHLNIERNY